MRARNYQTKKATGLAAQFVSNALQPLSRNCPGLANFDWINYLQCSMVRVDRVVEAISQINTPGLRVLDFGSWLGNFSLALKFSGWRVTSAEMWARYSPALDMQKQMLASVEIDCIDTSMIVGRPQGPCYGAVLLMSVIEHISDSPRRLLKILYDALLPGGLLVLDTPNLAYIYNRRRLARGLSIYPPIEEQFTTEVPFEGHVREYTADELEWMLIETGFKIEERSFFNYSMYGVSHPYLMNAASIVPMALYPAMRELIFMVGRKPYA